MLKRVQERRDKRKKVIIGIIISVLMVLSGFGVYLSGAGAQQSLLKEQGVKFKINYDLNVYEAKISGVPLQFYFLPSGVSDVVVTAGFADPIRNAQAVVVTFDPTVSQVNLQVLDSIRFDFSSILGKPVINAVLSEHPSYPLPVVSCANATVQLPVIAFELADKTRIVHDGSCVTIYGNESSFLAARDRFVYEYYGIFNERD
jgi:hypothetical protein